MSCWLGSDLHLRGNRHPLSVSVLTEVHRPGPRDSRLGVVPDTESGLGLRLLAMRSPRGQEGQSANRHGETMPCRLPRALSTAQSGAPGGDWAPRLPQATE